MTLTDKVQYIVADAGWPASGGSPAVPASFYWDLQTHEELRAAFASQGVYTPRASLSKYCLQGLEYEDTCAAVTGVSGFDPTIESLFSNGGRVYHDFISGKNLLTFRGTEGFIFNPAGLDDWYNNIKQAADPPAPQYTTAMTDAVYVATKWSGPTGAVFAPLTPADWLITGHSLGGGLAAAASVVSGFQADTFNAAGVNYVTVQQFCQNHPNLGLTITSQAQLQSRAAGLVTSYVVDGEILNYIQDGNLAQYLGLPASIGYRVTLDSHRTIWTLYTRLELHSYYVESLLLSYGFPLSQPE
jgi:hypothetical protein